MGVAHIEVSLVNDIAVKQVIAGPVPWHGGRHPVLDRLVVTPSALIGIESSRFEPFRGGKAASLSGAIGVLSGVIA